jgi:DNA mismatch endonuclease (patch repair protein)
MARVRCKDTAIEKKVRSRLHERGYRFRKHVARLPGSPDIILPRYKAAIFVHGCFWHGHSGCRKSRLPTTERDFWEKKRTANLERDARKISELGGLGWRVAVLWQCALEKPVLFSQTMDELIRWISSGSSHWEIPSRQMDGGPPSSGMY